MSEQAWQTIGYIFGLLLTGVGGGFIYRFFNTWKENRRKDLEAKRQDDALIIKNQEAISGGYQRLVGTIEEQSKLLLADRARLIARLQSKMAQLEETVDEIKQAYTKVVIENAQLKFELAQIGKTNEGR